MKLPNEQQVLRGYGLIDVNKIILGRANFAKFKEFFIFIIMTKFVVNTLMKL